MDAYQEFLKRKAVTDPSTGLDLVPCLNPSLFPFQRDVVGWALKRGRAALFEDCGLGKTIQQLEWAYRIREPVLILAPLAVSAQTVREGQKFGIGVQYARRQSGATNGITITNYEMLEHFDPSYFTGVILDESSILKAFDGNTRTALIDAFSETPFRLCCSASPAPNDYMELGNHAEFLGIMTYSEMLSMFFVHDGGETQKWRLKGHAQKDFWKWMSSWAVVMRKPSDLGYEDDGFILPEMVLHQVTVKVDKPSDGFLFPMEAQTLQERLAARRSTIQDRIEHCASLVNGAPGEQWIIWANLNAEADGAARSIHGAVNVQGSDSRDVKEKAVLDFLSGHITRMVSKVSIFGFGLNLQVCHNVVFLGLSDSFESYYQAVRRCWRFGQTNTVNVYIITAETEGAVVANIKRKERDAENMANAMVEHMKDLNSQSVRGASSRFKTEYERDTASGEGWTQHLGDCVELCQEMKRDSVDYTVYSPPFSSLYTYSASDRDMGNCKDDDMFMEQYQFLVNELIRITKPGRLLSFHCINLPTSKTHHGYIGIRDFRGDLIRVHEKAGWIYHSEVCIWKDPVTAMQRTKALGLLHKQLKKDSCMSRQGLPDYLVTMRKPGENTNPVSHTNDSYPVSEWQNIASPIWMDINPSDTLQFRSAREHADEKHICPLQLEVIRRALRLWSNPGDLILDPFSGIGSTGYVALQMQREFLGVELKKSYFLQAVRNLRNATRDQELPFDLVQDGMVL